MKDLLDKNGCGHIKIFGGGGGTILPEEIEELHKYGIARIYSPDDGRNMGLEGMIEDVIGQCQRSTSGEDSYTKPGRFDKLPLDEVKDVRLIARAITFAENGIDYSQLSERLRNESSSISTNDDRKAVLGITGTAVQEKVL